MSQNQSNNLFPLVASITVFLGLTIFELGRYFGRQEILDQNTTTITTITLTERLIYPDGTVTYKPIECSCIRN